jgi:hypothetical protein
MEQPQKYQNKITTKECILEYQKDKNWDKLLNALEELKRQKNLVNNSEGMDKEERYRVLNELESEIIQLQDYINDNLPSQKTVNDIKQKEIKHIFFSWQSDIKICKSVIENALDKVVTNLNKRDNVKCNYKIDEATRGESGSPNITTTILEKIANCYIFIADITIITDKKDKSRPAPNPNVMFELGYASATVGWSKIILLRNIVVLGEAELPFDIRQHRYSTFSSSTNNKEFGLAKQLEAKIKFIDKDDVNIAYHKTIEHLKQQASSKNDDDDDDANIVKDLQDFIIAIENTEHNPTIKESIDLLSNNQKIIDAKIDASEDTRKYQQYHMQLEMAQEHHEETAYKQLRHFFLGYYEK